MPIQFAGFNLIYLTLSVYRKKDCPTGHENAGQNCQGTLKNKHIPSDP
jgi:hypothetical protein